MRGWLVYSPEGYALNRWFADRLLSAADANGLDLALMLVQDGAGLPPEPLPDFAVVRTIRPDISSSLEARGVRVFNNAATAHVANDKWQTFRLAAELGLAVLDTERFTCPELPSMPFPCVVKSLDGHGGSEVFAAHDASAVASIAVQTGKRTFVAQPFCDEPGVDMRVYVLGGKPIAAVRRESKEGFRSNFKLGGEASSATPEPGQREVVAKLHDRIGFDFVGVDFIRHRGQWVLNEIEDVVGTRMLYATTDIDAADLFIRHICALCG